MISQLKDSGVQVTVNNREPVPLSTNFLANYLTDRNSHEHTGRRDIRNTETTHIAEGQTINSSDVLAPPLVTDPDMLAYSRKDTVGSPHALGIDSSTMDVSFTVSNGECSYSAMNSSKYFVPDNILRTDININNTYEDISLPENLEEFTNDDKEMEAGPTGLGD
ncbi:unnamed protein product [Mytilus coruscus]|uniref:Uncharacterized protein n=1 Tax=Mytilus coruscus TaxID=42192 RepID=A0A6J8A702_MYTCO|nr:unnamed protein product [Mytilus coruscus]